MGITTRTQPRNTCWRISAADRRDVAADYQRCNVAGFRCLCGVHRGSNGYGLDRATAGFFGGFRGKDIGIAVQHPAGQEVSDPGATLARPLVAGFNYIASADAIKRLADNLSILPGSKRAYYLEVADLIKTGLRYLEEVNIPAEERELRMIRGILRMDVVKVREIMTPRPDILAVGINDSVTDVLSLMRDGGHSKLPVYETSLDNVNNIRGVLFALDLLGVSDRDTDLDIPTLAREAVLVTEFQSVETLLRTFQQQRTSMALVVNEHGGIDGLVTVTDVIEEIVGELMDEFDKGLPELQTVSRHEILADAGVTIDQLNQVLGVESQLPEDVDTIGGLIYGRLDKMPQLGDQITEGSLRVSVTNMTGRRIRRVRITQMKTPDENS